MQFSDTLTILPIRRVAQGARRWRSVDRNSFRSPRGAYDSGSVQHRPPGSTSVRTAIFPVCYGAGLRRCHAEADLSGAGSRSYPGCLKAPDRSLMNTRESERFCPSSPQPPSPLVGEGGSLRVLKPKTREGTQELPKKPVPVGSRPQGFPVPWLAQQRGVLCCAFPDWAQQCLLLAHPAQSAL